MSVRVADMRVIWTVPCDVCSSGRRLQCAGVELEAGGAAAHTAVEAVARMDLVAVDREATHWGRGGDTAAAAGTADVVDRSCRVAALAEAVEGEQSPSGLEIKCQQAVQQLPARCA
jgi:hypothetical protein